MEGVVITERWRVGTPYEEGRVTIGHFTNFMVGTLPKGALMVKANGVWPFVAGIGGNIEIEYREWKE